MLDTLRFVRGAVATKDLVPVLTAFHLYEGRIQGTNGYVTIDAAMKDVKVDDITVNAERFLKAIDACDGNPIMKTTPNNKLSIKKGSFKALIPLAKHDDFPRADPDKMKAAKLNLLPTLKILNPFVGQDASRPWACGILVQDGFMYATNNIIIARSPFEWKHEAIVLPSFTVDELLRIGVEPIKIGFSDSSVTFGYKDGSWIKSTLFHNNWPTHIGDMIKHAGTKHLVKSEMIEGINKILPFCPDPKFPAIKIKGDLLSTMDGDMTASIGKGSDDDHESAFRVEPLLAVLAVAKYLDLSKYPDACPFNGDDVEGLIVGIRP